MRFSYQARLISRFILDYPFTGNFFWLQQKKVLPEASILPGFST